jgi:hypothetical protein
MVRRPRSFAGDSSGVAALEYAVRWHSGERTDTRRSGHKWQ